MQHSYRKQLRPETMFLAINLFDRFLSKGYFKAERNLHIVGIACLTLATRIEENQQYNRFIVYKLFFVLMKLQIEILYLLIIHCHIPKKFSSYDNYMRNLKNHLNFQFLFIDINLFCNILTSSVEV